MSSSLNLSGHLKGYRIGDKFNSQGKSSIFAPPYQEGCFPSNIIYPFLHCSTQITQKKEERNENFRAQNFLYTFFSCIFWGFLKQTHIIKRKLNPIFMIFLLFAIVRNNLSDRWGTKRRLLCIEIFPFETKMLLLQFRS